MKPIVYHIWITKEARMSLDDENPNSEGMCVTLMDGLIVARSDSNDSGEDDDDLDELTQEDIDRFANAALILHRQQ